MLGGHLQAKDREILGSVAASSIYRRGARDVVFIDGNYLKRSWGGSFENVAIMVTIGINDDGHREASAEKAEAAALSLEGMKLKEAARRVRGGVAETLAYTRFPLGHWRRIRTNNAIERLNREIRRRTRVVGTFPDGRSALMLVCARLRHVAESEWGKRRCLDMSLLDD